MTPSGTALDALNLVAGEWCRGPSPREMVDRYTGDRIGLAYEADAELAKRAVGEAVAASMTEAMSGHERYEVLLRVAQRVEQERASFAELMRLEAGFPSSDANTEITRGIQTLTQSAEEAKRITGEMVPMEGAPGFAGTLAFTLRVPVGVVCAITPFNAPLNTVAHKIGPALAAGNSVVLKPSTYTPLTAAKLCAMFSEEGLPPGWLNLVLGPGDPIAQALVADERIGFYTFTGSTAVGSAIARGIGLRRSSLELGSVSATIVCADADLVDAADQVATAGFRKAGQVCTSVQRLFVERPAVEAFCALLADRVGSLQAGDPADPAIDVGPLISEAAAEKAEAWVAEAVSAGARVLAGGRRERAVMEPTLLIDAPSDSRVVCEEIFAPVVTVLPVDSVDEAIDRTNSSPFGLQAGIFTADLGTALLGGRRLAVGGVIVNGTSSTRADLMPYGGVKDSGHGKEGPRYAIREMTQERLIVIRG